MIESENLLQAFDSRDVADRDRLRILLVVLLDIRGILANLKTTIEKNQNDI